MSIHESGQMYLETIYILSQNKSYVRAIDVGEHLGYSKPSVSRAMSILKKNGYVLVDADGAITNGKRYGNCANYVYPSYRFIGNADAIGRG